MKYANLVKRQNITEKSDFDNLNTFLFFLNLYVFLTPPALPGSQVHVGAIGCLEQTKRLGNLVKVPLPGFPRVTIIWL